MATKRYDEMTREELDAWYERHQRLRGVRILFILLIVFGIAWGAWSTLRVWHAHTQAQMRAEQQQTEELKNIELEENAAEGTAAPHTVDTAAPLPADSAR